MTEISTLSFEEKKKVKKVFSSYFAWFFLTTFLAVLGTVAAHFTNTAYALQEIQIKLIQILSLILEATSLGQYGYGIQTWGGESPAEKWNQRLFTFFSCVGFFLLVFSFQLKYL